jgi:hypothetical protein
MRGRQIDFTLGTIHAKLDGFLGFLTRKVIDQLNLYFAGYGILFVVEARCRPPADSSHCRQSDSNPSATLIDSTPPPATRCGPDI